MPKANDQVGTRERLVAAAAEEIAERGWAGARSRSIAARAGVNNALVHYHFGTMEDLLVAACAAALERALGELDPGSVAAPDLAGGLEGVVAGLAGMDPADPTWQVLMEAFVQTPRVPRLAEITLGMLEEVRRLLQERIEAAIAAGDLPAGSDARGLAVALAALLDGLGLHAYVDQTIDARRAGAALSALLRQEEEA